MTGDEFVGQVQARAKLPSRMDAERAIRATLDTLGERIVPGLADNLAAQLPAELGHHLRHDHCFLRMHVDEFLERIRERESEPPKKVDLPDAVYHARVVFEVLKEAVSPGIIEKIRGELPAEFHPLIDKGSKGKLELKRSDEHRDHA